jgi:AcrR family transcriptional regulator
MAPRKTTFDKRAVLETAVALVRDKGWESLTARVIADGLGASVAPVYSTFGSMDSLQREILLEAARLLHERTTVAYTEGAFLNIGVGIVVFARDEANLFRALFHVRHRHTDINEAIFTSILKRMKADPLLRQLSNRSLERLLDYLGTYTIGLAGAAAQGRLEDGSTEAVIRYLRDVGNMMILGEVMGTADSGSPESRSVWDGLLAEKKLVLPAPENCPAGTTKENT